MPNENLLVVEMKLVQRAAVEHCLHPLARAGVLKNDVIEIGDRQFLAEPLPMRGWRRIEHLHFDEMLVRARRPVRIRGESGGAEDDYEVRKELERIEAVALGSCRIQAFGPEALVDATVQWTGGASFHHAFDGFRVGRLTGRFSRE